MGLANFDPNHGWIGTNNGTLEHEVWAGPLTADPTTGAPRKVVAFFNKGDFTESITAAADVLGTDRATGNVTVRDVEAQADLPALTPGQSLSVNVESHGTVVYVLTGI